MKKIAYLLIFFGLFFVTSAQAELVRPRSARLASANPYQLNPKVININCSREFIRPDGSFGNAGIALIQAVSRVGEQCFYEQANFGSVCPNYHRFPKAEKQRFLVWLFATIAHYESTCNPGAEARGTNDLAVGYYQLENSWRQRRDAGRDTHFCKSNQPVNNPKHLTFQSECAAAIFRDGYCSRRSRKVGVDRWYWHKLNRKNGAITQYASKFPGCR